MHNTNIVAESSKGVINNVGLMMDGTIYFGLERRAVKMLAISRHINLCHHHSLHNISKFVLN